MTVYTTLAKRYLTHQARRSLLTAVGIVLAVALVASAGSLAETIKAAQVEDIARMGGRHHAQIRNLSEAQVFALSHHRDIDEVGVKTELGGFTLEGGTSVTIEGFDENARDLLNLSLNQGRFPVGQREIALERWVLDQMGLEPVLGQEVSLSYETTRVLEDGKLEAVQGSGVFRLVGIMEDIPAAKAGGVSLAVVSNETVKDLLTDELFAYHALVVVREGLPVRDTLSKIQAALQIPDGSVQYHENLLRALGQKNVIEWPVVVVAALTVVAASLAIYSIFRISVAERVRQLGILRCVGATPAQIRKTVVLEGIMLGIVAVPVGLMLGFFFSGLIAGRVSLINQLTGGVRGWVLFSPTVALWSAGIGLLSVLVAVTSPAGIAARVYPLQALRPYGSATAVSRSSRSRTARVIGRLLGVTGFMAYQNLWRNRSRTLITILSMSLAVVMFIVYSFYVGSADPARILEDYLSGDYALKANVLNQKSGYDDSSVRAVRAIPGVLSVSPVYAGVCHISGDSLPKPSGRPGTPSSGLPAILYGYDEVTLSRAREFIVSGTIPEPSDQGLPSQEAWALVCLNDDLDVSVGDKIDLEIGIAEGTGVTKRHLSVTVAGILSRPPAWAGFRTEAGDIILTADTWRDFTGSTLSKIVNIAVSQEAREADASVIQSRLQAIAHTTAGGSVISYAEELARLEREKREMSYLLYGLVGMIGLIGLFSILNSIATNLIVRTREFGTLRALGLTSRQLSRMVQTEGMFYGLLSALWGSLLGGVLSYVLYRLLGSSMGYLVWTVPWKAVGAAWIAGLLVGCLATAVPVRRLGGMSIIESLRVVE